MDHYIHYKANEAAPKLAVNTIWDSLYILYFVQSSLFENLASYFFLIDKIILEKMTK